MNPIMTDLTLLPPQAAIDALQSRFALKVTAKLSERASELAPDLSERLRFSRETALERARAARRAEAVSVDGGGARGAAILGRLSGGWWLKAASVAPMLVLAAGLFLIQRWQESVQISAAAEVDAALLADDLPPTAYRDVGFAEFLKTPGE
jgi:Tfp pilus assembly protein FimT